MARKSTKANKNRGGNESRPADPQDDSLRDIVNALRGAYQAVEEKYGAATVRHVEGGIDDILSNAVVMGYPNRFEDMREAAAFTQLIAEKLARSGFLPAAAMPHAPVMLAGLLRHLWDSQNLMYLAPEMAEGQAGTVRVLVDDIVANWAPPDGKPWYALVEPAPRLVDDVLTFIDKLKWEEIYKHLDVRMDGLAKDLKAMLDKVRASHPTALGACAAYVSGTVIVKNTFSPLDGSVPESIGERLTKVYHALDADNEARFWEYLVKGFERVRNRQPDELDRWRMEPAGAPPASSPGPKPPDAAKPRHKPKSR
jgi:hypothetical protein